MKTRDLLLEIGCEELPGKQLVTLITNLVASIKVELNNAELAYQSITQYSTPRRLAVIITGLIEQQPSQQIEKLGPSVNDAYHSDGTATAACLGFARSCGVDVTALTVKKTNKGERLCHRVECPGRKTIEVLPELINKAIDNMPKPRTMRWADYDVAFVRPVHWVVLLFGETVIPATILTKKTSNITYGHRFHYPHAIQLTSANDYVEKLAKIGFVIVDGNKRKAMIKAQAHALIDSDQQVIIDAELLDEVAALVEWPIAQIGQFDAQFLTVPKEALISAMETHQKCFPVVDKNEQLQPYFILVSNIESKNQQKIIEGNERVIHARLSDATFFYEQDSKHTLESRTIMLTKVVFEKQLGTLAQKSKRIASTASHIAKLLKQDQVITKRAGLLSKCDLVTEMVYEFPNLQGIMGYYYATNDGETKECALAIKEHYYPRFSGDQLPNQLIGCALAIADRLDTLVGIIGVNKIPTGDKDPFALRRAAVGLLRLLIEKQLPLDLMKLLHQATKTYQKDLPNVDVVTQTFEFCYSRLKTYYQEQGVHTKVFNAVAARQPTQPLDFHYRIQAVQHFQQLPEADALSAANKRVSNILKQTVLKNTIKLDSVLLQQGEEKNLAHCLEQTKTNTQALYQSNRYTEILSNLANLKQPIDQFFDHVMVMVDDEKIRNNRLALLSNLRFLMTQVADIALLSK